MIDEVALRKINEDDLKLFSIWWRDEYLIKLTSGNLEPVTDDDIKGYFQDLINSKDDKHFIIQLSDKSIGHISLSKRENNWYEIQVIIGDKKCIGMGYGPIAINLMLNEAKKENINKLYLEVRPTNIRAIKAYEKCGFVKAGSISYESNANLSETLRMERFL